MFINIIKSYRYVVALADGNLIGKKFEEGNVQLDVKENFYKGEEKSAEEIVFDLKNMQMEDATFNIVGNESVELALKHEIISEGNIGEICGVKFAMVFM